MKGFKSSVEVCGIKCCDSMSFEFGLAKIKSCSKPAKNEKTCEFRIAKIRGGSMTENQGCNYRKENEKRTPLFEL